MIYIYQRRYPEAEESLELALEIDPQNVPVLYNLGVASARLQKWDEAIGTLERVYAIASQFKNVRRLLHSAYVDSARIDLAGRKWQSAEAKLRRALEVGERSIGFYRTHQETRVLLATTSLHRVRDMHRLAQIEEVRPGLEEVKSIYQSTLDQTPPARKQSPESIELRFGLAEVYWLQGEYGRARDMMRDVLRVEPGHLTAKRFERFVNITRLSRFLPGGGVLSRWYYFRISEEIPLPGERAADTEEAATGARLATESGEPAPKQDGARLADYGLAGFNRGEARGETLQIFLVGLYDLLNEGYFRLYFGHFFRQVFEAFQLFVDPSKPLAEGTEFTLQFLENGSKFAFRGKFWTNGRFFRHEAILLNLFKSVKEIQDGARLAGFDEGVDRIANTVNKYKNQTVVQLGMARDEFEEFKAVIGILDAAILKYRGSKNQTYFMNEVKRSLDFLLPYLNDSDESEFPLLQTPVAFDILSDSLDQFIKEFGQASGASPTGARLSIKAPESLTRPTRTLEGARLAESKAPLKSVTTPTPAFAGLPVGIVGDSFDQFKNTRAHLGARLGGFSPQFKFVFVANREDAKQGFLRGNVETAGLLIDVQKLEGVRLAEVTDALIDRLKLHQTLLAHDFEAERAVLDLIALDLNGQAISVEALRQELIKISRELPLPQAATLVFTSGKIELVSEGRFIQPTAKAANPEKIAKDIHQAFEAGSDAEKAGFAKSAASSAVTFLGSPEENERTFSGRFEELMNGVKAYLDDRLSAKAFVDEAGGIYLAVTDARVYSKDKESYKKQIDRLTRLLQKQNAGVVIVQTLLVPEGEEKRYEGEGFEIRTVSKDAKNWSEVQKVVAHIQNDVQARGSILIANEGELLIDEKAGQEKDSPFLLEVDSKTPSLYGVPIVAGAVVVAGEKITENGAIKNLEKKGYRVFRYLPINPIDLVAVFKAAYERIVAVGSAA